METIKSCAIIGATPNEYSFGYCEESENCVSERALLVKAVLELVSFGVTEFYSTLEYGAELWAAEAVAAISASGGKVELLCAPASENQADRWPEYVRDRYFDLIERFGDDNALPKLYDKDGRIDPESEPERFNADDYIFNNAESLVIAGPENSRAEALAARFTEAGRIVVRIP